MFLLIRTYLFGVLWVAVALFNATSAHADDGQWTGEPVPVHEIVIQAASQPQPEKSFDWPGLARDVVAIQPGDILTREKLEQAETTLKVFVEVKSSIHMVAQGATITFFVQPYPRIKAIDINGAYPLFERDIRNIMTLAPGDIFRPQAVLDQADLIAQRYQAEGYIDPKVTITWQQDPDDGQYDITIDIQKGAAYILRHLKLSGNRSIVADALLKGRMATWRSATLQLGTGRWVESQLKEDIQTLLAYYRSQGFADVQIDYTVRLKPRQATADVQVTIDEGPRYRLEFDGNRFFSDTTLRVDLALFEKGNRGNMGLRRTIQNMRQRYLQAGFAQVQVRWHILPAQADPSKERTVRIEIQEGERHIVEQVTIVGNHALSTEAIQAQILTRPPHGLSDGAYVAAVLNEDVAALGALYQQSGYLDARISDTVAIDPKTRRVTVTLTIDEGARTRVGTIHFKGPSPVAADQLLAFLPFKTGAIYMPQLVREGENEVAARIAAKGYPHVQVLSRADPSKERPRVDIVYDIDPGPFVEVGRILWTGNFHTRNALMRREIQIEEGEPFSLARVLAAQRRLRDLNLFQSVQVRTIGLKERAPKVHLLVTLVEKTAYYFELGAGYQTDKGVYVRTKVGDNNFLGLNKALRLGGEVSGIGYRWDANVLEPSLLGSNVSAGLGLYTERREAFNQDFGTDTTGGKLTFSRPWDERLTTALGVTYERREQYLRDTTATAADVDPATLEPRTIWVTTPAIRFDSRDSFIRPHKGNFVSMAADISKGLDSSLDNFIKYKMDLRTYYAPQQQLTLAARAFAGYIQPYDVQGQIPDDQLFFLGGTNDVRGFEENLLRYDADKNPVGGRLALAASVEARYEVTPAWELTLFVDAGSLGQTLSGVDDEDDSWQWTSGLGLRYLTPIGPIGLLYGHKLNPRPGESNGQFHFSIGYTF
jgi:outer membrane protein insertion porin family